MTPSSRHQPADPTAGRQGGAEAPVRPVLAPRHRPATGILALGAAALIVILAGAGILGRGSEPSPSDIGLGSASASSPTDTPEGRSASAPPPPTPSTACRQLVDGRDPHVVVGPSSSTSGLPSSFGDPGLAGWRDGPDPIAAWPTPALDTAIEVSGRQALAVSIDDDSCIRWLEVDYLPISTDSNRAIATLIPGRVLDPAKARVPLGALPAGDWVVRVGLRYQARTPELQAVLHERWFRVVVVGIAAPTPYITPGAACGMLTAADPAPRLRLAIGAGTPVPGVDLAAYPGDPLHNGAIVVGELGDELHLVADGDPCATSWTVDLFDQETGSLVLEFAESNPLESLAYIAQNRIDLANAPIGRFAVLAHVTYGRGRVANAGWEISTAGPPPPEAILDVAGLEIAPAIGCGTGWRFPDGREAFESCASNHVPDLTPSVSLEPGTPIRLRIPGWDILGWGADCAFGAGIGGEFGGSAWCFLGGGGNGNDPSGPVMILPYEGSSVIRITVTARLDDHIVYASYYVAVQVAA